MGFTFASEQLAIEHSIEQDRREKEKTLTPMTAEEKAENTLVDAYRTEQNLKGKVSENFFEALINHAGAENNPLLALDQALEESLKPQRGKPHHLKKLLQTLAVHEVERSVKKNESSNAKTTKKEQEEAKKQRIAEKELELGRVLLAVLVQGMVNEVISVYGSTFDDVKQLTAERLLRKIVPSVKIEILVRFGYAGTSQKIARQNSQRLETHLKKDMVDVDAFFEQFGLDKDAFDLTIKSMIEVIAGLSGLFEKIDNSDSYKPSQLLLDKLKREGMKVYLNPIHLSMPMISPPDDWGMNQRGGYYYSKYLSLDKHIPLNKFIESWKNMMMSFEMPEVYSAVNALQATAWQINHDVLKVVKAVYGSDATNLTSSRLQDLNNKANGNYKDRENKPHIMLKRRLGLDSEQQFTYQVLLEDLEKQPAFWYPWTMDARGRLYPKAPWLSIQSDDFARGILQFADRKPVTSEEAKSYLAVHGSQFVQKKIMKSNLGIEDCLNLTADERYRWIKEHQQDIIDSANDPLKNTWWTDVADNELWQFLAFCFAWRDMSEGKPIALPVMMDGSCNGLQHMSALTQSALIAKQTNLTHNERPEDIYTYIKDKVNAYLDNPSHPDKHTQNPAKTNRAFILDWIKEQPNFMSRDISKKVVIGFSYGSRKYKDKILEALQSLDIFKTLQDNKAPPIDASIIDFANTLFVWEGDENNHIEGSIKFDKPDSINVSEKTEDDENNNSDDDVKEESNDYKTIVFSNHQFNIRPNLANAIAWLNQPEETDEAIIKRHRQVLSAWLRDRLASYLALQFKEVMEEELKDAVSLMDWLMECTKQFGALPTCWLSPVGVPVLQDKFIKRVRKQTKKEREKAEKEGKKPKEYEPGDLIESIESQLYGVFYRGLQQKNPDMPDVSKDIKTRIYINSMKETVDKVGQRTAIPPNFIHSLDASHLMMTVNSAVKEGIDQFAMVHDSYGTHAEDAPKLARILREKFIELHSTPQLQKMQEWITLVQGVLNQQPIDALTNNPAQQTMLKQLEQRVAAFSEEEKATKSNMTLKPFAPASDSSTFNLEEVKQARYFFS